MTDIILDSVRSEPEQTENPDLTAVQRITVGGIGGIMPIIATLMVSNYFPSPITDGNYYVGIFLRVVLFFAVGAGVVWLHKDVWERYPVFRLGLTAPAMIAAMISTGSANAADTQAAIELGASEVRVAALETAAKDTVMSDALPSNIFFGNCTILDGFLGRKCK